MAKKVEFTLPSVMHLRPDYFTQEQFDALSAFVTALGQKMEDECIIMESMIVFAKTMPFLKDNRFLNAALRNATIDGDGFTLQPATIVRLYNTVLCARAADQAAPENAGLIEVGCALGNRIGTVLDALKGCASRPVFLYDLFGDDVALGAGDSYAATRARFANNKNVSVIKGPAPASVINRCPEEIALAIFDTGIPDVDIASAATVIDRVVRGGYLYFATAFFMGRYPGTGEEARQLVAEHGGFSPLFWSPAGDAWAYRL